MLEIVPLTTAVGAEIHGVDLRNPVSQSELAQMHDVLMEHLVIFFRDQHLSPAQQRDFAARWGPLRIAQKAAFDKLDDVPEMAVLINDESRPPNVNHYHSDGIFRSAPEFASLLRAEHVPQAGGDTVFVSMQAAFDALSEDMKRYVQSKSASNDFMKLHGSPAKSRSWKGDNFERMDALRKQNPPVIHPLVKCHPVSGRLSLYLSESFTTHIVDVTAEESNGVLDFLFRHCAKPEYQCRFHWRADSMALWDNRATMHYAVADYWPAKRLMHRVTIETDALGTARHAA